MINIIPKKYIYLMCLLGAILIILFTLINAVIAYSTLITGDVSGSIFANYYYDKDKQFYEITINDDSIFINNADVNRIRK